MQSKRQTTLVASEPRLGKKLDYFNCTEGFFATFPTNVRISIGFSVTVSASLVHDVSHLNGSDLSYGYSVAISLLTFPLWMGLPALNSFLENLQQIPDLVTSLSTSMQNGHEHALLCWTKANLASHLIQAIGPTNDHGDGEDRVQIIICKLLD